MQERWKVNLSKATAKEKPYFSPTDDSFDISAFRDRSFKLYFRTKKAAKAPLALLTVSMATHHLRYLQPGQGWDGASGHEQRPLGGRWVAVGEGPWWGDRRGLLRANSSHQLGCATCPL